MKITRFAHIVSTHEKGKVQCSIAQISEILKIINKKMGGVLYVVIKLLPD
jgi:hypothetical protein